MAKLDWQEHFKASIKNVADLYSKDSTNVSLLLFCLRSKLIPVQDYLEWAKENYQLPVIFEKFFEIHKPQLEFYKKWQGRYNWSAECLPIAEWDGTLMVACLQIPVDYKNSNPTVFVLASHEILNSTWEIYQNPVRTSDTDFIDMSALAATVIATPEQVDFFNADGELALKDPSPAEKFSEELSEELELADLSEMSERDSGSPEGLFGEQRIPSETPIVAASENPKSEKGPRSVQPLMELKIEPVGESAVGLEIDTESVTSISEKNVISPEMNPTTSYLLEKIRQEGKEQFDKDLQANFQQLKTFFKKSMLLAVDDKDCFIKPIFWDGDHFDSQEQQNSEFKLETPSIFKIVNGTQKPYHGFVIVNDLNESFFESWNHGQIPDHITIVPILNGEFIAGMLMGFGEKSCYNKTVLQFTEKVAKDVSQKIFKTSAAKAA
ncbi:MAG TPA: hypothetical protein VIG33_03370 [Pseudobdellovibrionaceae bacterium]|jgi:hypothetical protein